MITGKLTIKIIEDLLRTENVDLEHWLLSFFPMGTNNSFIIIFSPIRLVSPKFCLSRQFDCCPNVGGLKRDHCIYCLFQNTEHKNVCVFLGYMTQFNDGHSIAVDYFFLTLAQRLRSLRFLCLFTSTYMYFSNLLRNNFNLL